jgi:hypothetical protein
VAQHSVARPVLMFDGNEPPRRGVVRRAAMVSCTNATMGELRIDGGEWLQLPLGTLEARLSASRSEQRRYRPAMTSNSTSPTHRSCRRSKGLSPSVLRRRR